ncbi:uncharacterized protein LOC110843915 isoform X2 [Folsomia candida]|uniref:Atrial natriuretic peptide-converting enzyme n=1 Tax=Folsomia candida TaxID=158441 RepID=A0A226F6I0_FOLCA|nr:uncharacterized protein LOC110843915 isoform X2 [Folsomia candida]XP_035706385.1 uncharacterized protein LOC110843915 isoform X2 [Folsomia candida]XP_035706390.1 uncharacterized protein LOC110843915 isoform X2 [Folsomia candida]OXA65058.1 Atrial natriuretic peptide-converting enzyme [Folsomia candida]
MDSHSRHHHHSVHSCHLKHHANSNAGGNGFDRYGGGFPQLSRIFPPISSSSSTTSSTASDIHVTRKFRFHRKLCACIAVAVLFVGIGACVGIYLGYQFLSMSPLMEQVFRGTMTIRKGDTYDESLSKLDSSLFKNKSQKYKSLIDSLYSQSVVKNAFIESEILAFDGIKNGPLTVYFNLHVDTHRIRVDAGDLFIVFADFVRNAKGILNGTLVVDQDSLEIQERSMAFLYLPATTDRNYVVIESGNVSSEDSTYISTQRPSLFSSTTRHANKHEKVSKKSQATANDLGEVLDSSSESSSINSVDGSCAPLSIDFCVNVTSSKQQRHLDDLTVLQLASIVESQCYPFAAHFLCSWGVACQKEQHLDNNGLPLLPCRDYCDEFMSNCGHKLPRQIKDKLKCGGEWNGVGSCITKPGCVQSLYETGQKQRICDGVMDCIDFSDELHCPYCTPGHFHCGISNQCISPDKKCDGTIDCPNSSDEKACLTLAPSAEAAGYVHQYFNEGYLFVHDQGKLGKLCVERNESQSNSLWSQDSQLLLDNIGSSACELLGFRKVAFVRIQPDGEAEDDKGKDVGTYVRIQEPGSSTEVTFSAGTCPSKKVLYVGCNHLECGQRPSHQRNSKGWAGHGDWPWHAALFKDGDHVCDATLVTSQWLITSDNCFSGQSKARWTVHFGRVRMSTVSPWQQERRVVGMVKSPLGDHLVLIKMASPVIFSDFARHICLPDEPEGRTGLGFPSWEKIPSNCKRLGWSKGDELVETPMHQLSQESCNPIPFSRQKKSPISPKPSALCFENDPPGRDCLKEIKVFPGGAIYCQNEETKEWALAGIVPTDSRPKCGIEKQRVSAIGGSTDWILKTIEALTNNS